MRPAHKQEAIDRSNEVSFADARSRQWSQEIMTLYGIDGWAPAKPRPDERLIRALARAHRWKRLLEEGTYRSVAELSEAEKINKGYVSRIFNLTLLAPDLTEAILDGRQPKGLQLEEIARGLPLDWQAQRAHVS